MRSFRYGAWIVASLGSFLFWCALAFGMTLFSFAFAMLVCFSVIIASVLWFLELVTATRYELREFSQVLPPSRPPTWQHREEDSTANLLKRQRQAFETEPMRPVRRVRLIADEEERNYHG